MLPNPALSSQHAKNISCSSLLDGMGNGAFCPNDRMINELTSIILDNNLCLESSHVAESAHNFGKSQMPSTPRLLIQQHQSNHKVKIEKAFGVDARGDKHATPSESDFVSQMMLSKPLIMENNKSEIREL